MASWVEVSQVDSLASDWFDVHFIVDDVRVALGKSSTFSGLTIASYAVDSQNFGAIFAFCKEFS